MLDGDKGTGMEKHSSIWAYVASVCTAVFGGVTLQDLALWVGIASAIGTFVINWYYKEREADRFDRLERRGDLVGGRRAKDHYNADSE